MSMNVKNNTSGKTKKFIIEAKNISDDDAFSFFCYTLQTFNDLIDEVEDEYHTKLDNRIVYSKNTDRSLLSAAPYNFDCNDYYRYLFLEISFHATNKTFGDRLRFNNSFNEYEKFTCNFNADLFLEYVKAKGVDLDNIIVDENTLRLFEKELPNAISNIHLKTNQSFVRTLITSAIYVKSLKDNKKKLVEDYKEFCQGSKDIVESTSKFLESKKIFGFGAALTFDFLKEHDSEVFNYPKPDLHIVRVINYYLNPFIRDYVKENSQFLFKVTDKKQITDPVYIVKVFIEIMNKVRKKLSKMGIVVNVSNYILDKYIYIICSGNLYLHSIKYSKKKKSYLRAIATDEYKNTPCDRDKVIKLLESLEIC